MKRNKPIESSTQGKMYFVERSQLNTLAGWLSYFFMGYPEEIQNRISDALWRIGKAPKGKPLDDCSTNDLLSHFTPNELCELWYTVVLPLAGMETPKLVEASEYSEGEAYTLVVRTSETAELLGLATYETKWLALANAAALDLKRSQLKDEDWETDDGLSLVGYANVQSATVGFEVDSFTGAIATITTEHKGTIYPNVVRLLR